MNEIGDIVADSSQFAMGGLWSGSEGRQKQHFIGIVPISRYRNGSDDEGFISLPQDKPRPKPKPRPAPRPKPKPRPFCHFTGQNFVVMKRELHRGISESIRNDLHSSYSRRNYLDRFESWIQNNLDGWYKKHPAIINHHTVSNQFMEALIAEYRNYPEQLMYFLNEEFK